jgi:hypothetical protein
MESLMNTRERQLAARVGSADWFELAEIVAKIRDHGPWMNQSLNCFYCDQWQGGTSATRGHKPGCLWTEIEARVRRGDM